MAGILITGDSAPHCSGQLVEGQGNYYYDKLAGRPIVLLFLGSTTWPDSMAALRVVAANRALFDDRTASFFGVTIDIADIEQRRVRPQLPGIRFFDDRDRDFSTAFGAVAQKDGESVYHGHWLLLDQALRVLMTAPVDRGDAVIAALNEYLAKDYAPPAPVLMVPRVFEPGMCQRLIALYEQHGGIESGFMNDVDGRTVEHVDHRYKRRSDHHIEDADLQAALSARISRFLLPPIKQAFQFSVTRLERFMVGCYDSAEEGGHFKPHRDDITSGTAHRRFACTINLNAEDYEGGDLRFPEFGSRTYRAPTGGAVIFSCSLLHEVLPVRRGRRYAFLPFFFDEAGGKLREKTMHLIDNAGAPAA